MSAYDGCSIVRSCGAIAIVAICIVAMVLGACAQPEEPGVVTPEPPAAPGAGQAHLAGGGELPLILSWQEPGADGTTALRMSRFERGGWTAAQTIAAGASWFVNWADFPSVVPLAGNLLVAHWLPLKPEQRYAYDIAWTWSSDGGQSWSTPQILNADEAIAEHGFVSFFSWGEDIGAIWLDGRAIAALSIDELFELEEPVGMTLRYARMSRGGDVLERGEIDELVCDCCQTDAVTTGDGPVIVYRDRTYAEVRDIVIRRVQQTNTAVGQTRWSEPVVPGPDGWVIDGCPVNGAALSVAGSHLAVAWFTAADNRPRLRFAKSATAGRDFNGAITVSEQGVLGQVDVVVDADGTAWLSAWHRAEPGMELRVHRIDAATQQIDVRTVAQAEDSFPSDVPQMALSDGQLILAWSHIGNPGQLYTAIVPSW